MSGVMGKAAGKGDVTQATACCRPARMATKHNSEPGDSGDFGTEAWWAWTGERKT
jgi:hypothetical protein